ncbi:MAG: glutamine synthetase type III, partial [Lachnospiraceae bacterium]
GNGYSEEWVEEAKRRGLPNLNSMVEAIPSMTTEAAMAMFEKFKVFTKVELESRAEIQYESYAKTINIEARAMIDIASKQVIPAIMNYTRTLADTINAVTAAGTAATVQREHLTKISELLVETQSALNVLVQVADCAAVKEEGGIRANYYHETVVPAMEKLREPVDALEMIVDKEVWPMPSYGDLIFEV